MCREVNGLKPGNKTFKCDVTASLAVAEQRGTSQRPVLDRLNAPQLQREDEVQVGPTWLLVDRTGVQGDRPATAAVWPLTVSHVGRADGVDVDHREGGEEDLSGDRVYHIIMYHIICYLFINYYYLLLIYLIFYTYYLLVSVSLINSLSLFYLFFFYISH